MSQDPTQDQEHRAQAERDGCGLMIGALFWLLLVLGALMYAFVTWVRS